jgi:hypothetical protein
VSACPLYQILNQLLDFYEIQQEDVAFECGIEAIIFNSIAATIPK